jgi:hypothetical protein
LIPYDSGINTDQYPKLGIIAKPVIFSTYRESKGRHACQTSYITTKRVTGPITLRKKALALRAGIARFIWANAARPRPELHASGNPVTRGPHTLCRLNIGKVGRGMAGGAAMWVVGTANWWLGLDFGE